MAEIGEDLRRAEQILRQGGLVSIPTETVYGLGANGLNVAAVLQIFSVKERPSFDPLILHSTQEQIFSWAREIPKQAKLLADAFWPGPLTLVLPKSEQVPYEVTSGLDTVGLRVPKHPLTLELLAQLDFPISAPSANPFGYVSPTTAAHVNEQLGDKIDYILDGGSCPVGIESTIVGFPQGVPTIYRLGGLERDKIESVIGYVHQKTIENSKPNSPGMILEHYSPHKPLFLVNDFSEIQDDEGVVYILFGEALEVEQNRQFFLSREGNYYEASAKLYALLRTLDKTSFHTIVAKRLPEQGLGAAINDRLFKASVKKK